MAKLTKAERKQHAAAVEILKKDELTIDDKWFVLENWNPAADHNNGAVGAFFTPAGLARDFALEVYGSRIIDLCAGIGALAFMAYHYAGYEEAKPEIVCVEINPDYVEVGRKILPEATWICADVTDIDQLKALGRFDLAISNPPFGRIATDANAPLYKGAEFELKVVDIARLIADEGAFILPQNSTPFKYSGPGRGCSMEYEAAKYDKFQEQTGIRFYLGIGIDCRVHLEDWKGVAPAVEVIRTSFEHIHPDDLPKYQPAPVVVPIPAPMRADAVQLSLFAA